MNTQLKRRRALQLAEHALDMRPHRTRVDLSQPVPPLEQTSADLLARSPAQEPQGQSPSRPPPQQESPHARSR